MTPELRFPEFMAPWRDATAGDAFRNGKAKGAAGLPIWSVTLDRGMVPRESLDRHMEADAADATNLRAQPGDLVYNMMRMWQGAVGQATEECMVSPAYVVLSPKSGTCSTFFDHWFKAPHMLHRLKSFSHGLTKDRLRLYYADFAKIPLPLPAKGEQCKIANFMDEVAEKIALLVREKSALEDYKRGLMQRLFSGEVRFTREDGSPFPDWHPSKLGLIADIVGGGTPESGVPAYWNGSIPWFTPSEIKSKYLQGSERTITELGLRKSSAKLLPVGALVLSTRATVGEVGIATREVCTNQGFQSLILKEPHDNEFWYYWVRSHTHEFLRRSAGSTFLEINKSEVGKIPVMVPHTDEQKKISACLSSLDTKIDAVSAQITQIEAFKKGLLQKLFV